MSETAAAVKNIFDEMPSKLNTQTAASMDAVIQYDLTGDAASQHYCVIENGTCKVVEGQHEAPSMTVTMEAADFVDLIGGKLDGMSAFMSGKLKVGGDMALAMKLQSLFNS